MDEDDPFGEEIWWIQFQGHPKVSIIYITALFHVPSNLPPLREDMYFTFLHQYILLWLGRHVCTMLNVPLWHEGTYARAHCTLLKLEKRIQVFMSIIQYLLSLNGASCSCMRNQVLDLEWISFRWMPISITCFLAPGKHIPQTTNCPRRNAGTIEVKCSSNT